MSENLYRAPSAALGPREPGEAPEPTLDSAEAQDAIGQIRRGSNAGFIAGMLTLLVVTVVVFVAKGAVDPRLGAVDAWSYLDVAIVFACAIGIRRKSRVAAVSLLAYWILSKLYLLIETGRIPGVVVSLIFAYYFARAVQGTFTYARLQREANYRPRMSFLGKTVLGVGGVVAVLVVLGLAQIIGASGGWLASTEVLSGDELREEDRLALVEAGVLATDEDIELFYCDGFTVAEAGTILSDYGVTRYFVDENGDTQVFGIPYSQIHNVELIEDGDFVNDTVYQVNGTEPDQWLRLALPTEDDGDERFISALRARLGETPPE